MMNRTSSVPGMAGNTSSRPANARPIRRCGSEVIKSCNGREASMSSSDVLDQPADTLMRAAEALGAAITDPDRVPDPEFRALIANVVRLYAVKAENGMRKPLPVGGGGVTV